MEISQVMFATSPRRRLVAGNYELYERLTMESVTGVHRKLVSTTHKFHLVMTQSSQGMSTTAPRRGPALKYTENNIGKFEYRVVCEVVIENKITCQAYRGLAKRLRLAVVVTSEGKKWYKSHTEAKYFSNVILDDVQLEREFPRIMRRLQEL
ncbi:hypothetical protein H5410_051702 [Solanum commersonii]|uniref:Uncharacterized protein n=1 Tax=Solanum commersonii TaxID=4109 RepID=A0A9J5WZ64_SOLCO|nr:hypothetical protein H5410_051702 [Solanum commersonii]